MNNQILDVVTPIQFKNILLIPIKLDILKLFETNRIQFQISIKDNKIIVESPEIFQDLEIQDRPLELETTNV